MLTAGNIVTTATILYRSHLKSYLKISLISSLWLLVPILFGLLGSIFVIGFSDTFNSTSVLIFFLIATPTWLLLLVYCWAKAWLNSALISRLGFCELMNQPETPKAARKKIASQLWMFFLAGVLLGLVLVSVYIAFTLVFVIFLIAILTGIAVVFAGIFQGGSFPEDPTFIGILTVLGVLLYIVAIFIFLGGVLWFYARLFLLEVPIAVHGNTNALKALGVSWKLTQKNIRFVIRIISIAALVNLPLWTIVQGISALIQPLLTAWITSDYNLLFVFSYLISSIVGVVGNIVLLPFWQALKAVTYYDLRRRKEGLGLQLREVTADNTPSVDYF